MKHLLIYSMIMTFILAIGTASAEENSFDKSCRSTLPGLACDISGAGASDCYETYLRDQSHWTASAVVACAKATSGFQDCYDTYIQNFERSPASATAYCVTADANFNSCFEKLSAGHDKHFALTLCSRRK